MQKNHKPDGFDRLLADYRHSTHEYEDHDASFQDVLRPWPALSVEGKLGYIASGAALYDVPFERFAQAAREAVGDRPLPAGEQAYLRLHRMYQQTLWDHELPAFPREKPLPEGDPHRNAMESIDGVLHNKFERLLDDYLGSRQPFPDTDGRMRRFSELSAEGKVGHIARLAAIFSQPLSRFTEAVHDALDGQPLRSDQHACLELCYQYARQVRGHEPHPLPLAQHAGDRGAAPSPDPRFLAHIDPVLTELEAFGDAFERLARTGEQRQLAAGFKEWIHRTSHTFFLPGARTLADQLFGKALPQAETPPEQTPKQQHKL